MRRRCLVLASASLLWLSVAAGAADGASFSVDPTLITLSPRSSSALLVVRNQGSQAVRLQVSAFTWAQSLEGEMQLEPTDDIVFFPALFALDPGQERRIRVGTTAAYGAIEKSYRLFVEELPAERTPGAGSAVQMLTRMGVPVFLAAGSSRVEARLSAVGASGNAVTFTLENTGTVHFVPGSVRAIGTTATGETVIDRKLEGWYVLPGSARRFSLTVPAPACSRIRSMAFEVQVDGAGLKERLETPRGTCGP